MHGFWKALNKYPALGVGDLNPRTSCGRVHPPLTAPIPSGRPFSWPFLSTWSPLICWQLKLREHAHRHVAEFVRGVLNAKAHLAQYCTTDRMLLRRQQHASVRDHQYLHERRFGRSVSLVSVEMHIARRRFEWSKMWSKQPIRARDIINISIFCT